MPIDFESARKKYKPEKIKFLFVAEAPPEEGSGRFFYFENVSDKDGLFLETMKVLYLGENIHAKTIRPLKQQFLKRFQADGFYLIDASDTPIQDRRRSAKRQQIRQSLPSLRAELKELVTPEVGIILISKTVYDECSHILKEEGFNILNEGLIDFPSSSGQRKFREKLGPLLRKNGWVGGA